jgi:hypothetical protein
MVALGHPRVGGGLPGFSAPAKVKFKKNTDFVDMMISKVLRDLCFSLKQLLKLDDDWYNGILEKYNKNVRICRCFSFQLVLIFPVT